MYGNPDLKPETSINTEMGVYFVGDSSLTSNVTLFYNDFNDKIDKVNLDSNCSGRACDATYVNIEDAITYGTEAAISKQITASIKLAATYTFTHSEKKSGDDKGQPLTQMPRHLANLNADWEIQSDIRSWLRVSYRDKEADTITKDSSNALAPAVTYVDVGGNWQVTNNVRLMAGIYNLLDKQTTYEEYGYVEDGRRYWLAINTSF